MKLVKRFLRWVAEEGLSMQSRSPWLKSSPSSKASQLALYCEYRRLREQGVTLDPRDSGMRVFSGTDEDGVLLFVFAAIGFGSRVCVELGAADGIDSNCANLILNFSFHGLLIDGDCDKVRKGRRFYARHPDSCLYPPRFRHGFITAENVNALVADAGLSGEIDLLSVDIDGSDYWVWKALSQVSPRVVVIETHTEFGDRNIVVPYDASYRYPGKHPQYHGASPRAMVELGRQKGYRLVATNGYGFNFIFVKQTEPANVLPEISIEQATAHPRNRQRRSLSDEIKDWKYVSPSP